MMLRLESPWHTHGYWVFHHIHWVDSCTMWQWVRQLFSVAQTCNKLREWARLSLIWLALSLWDWKGSLFFFHIARITDLSKVARERTCTSMAKAALIESFFNNIYAVWLWSKTLISHLLISNLEINNVECTGDEDSTRWERRIDWTVEAYVVMIRYWHQTFDINSDDSQVST